MRFYKLFLAVFFLFASSVNLEAKGETLAEQPYIIPRLVEETHLEEKDGVALTFHFQIGNREKLSKEVIFWAGSLIEKEKRSSRFRDEIDEEGFLVNVNKKTGERVRHGLRVDNQSWGEVILVSIQDTKTKEKHYDQFAPFPLLATGKGGKSLELAYFTPDATQFLVRLRNFEDGEFLRMTSISEDEKIEHSFFFKPNFFEGSMILLNSPAVIGKKRGKGAYSITCEETGEKLTIDYGWGLYGNKKVTLKDWKAERKKVLPNLKPINV